MRCMNPRCLNELGQGSGFLVSFTPLTDDPESDHPPRFMCSPCRLYFLKTGISKREAQNRNWFLVEGDQFRVLIDPGGPVDSKMYPYLYGLWSNDEWYTEPDAVQLDTIILWTDPHRAEEYIKYRLPVAYFGISEPSNIGYSRRRFKVIV